MEGWGENADNCNWITIKIKKIKSTTFRTNTNNFAQVYSLQVYLFIWYPVHPFQLGNQVSPKIWKTQGPEQQLAYQFTSPYGILLTTHSFLKLMGIRPWIHYSGVKQVPPDEDTDLATAIDTTKESCTCTRESDLKFIFWKGSMPPKAEWQCCVLFYYCFWQLLSFVPMLEPIMSFLHFPGSGFLGKIDPLSSGQD